jgi:hypothetical protein
LGAGSVSAHRLVSLCPDGENSKFALLAEVANDDGEYSVRLLVNAQRRSCAVAAPTRGVLIIISHSCTVTGTQSAIERLF